ncbi:MAG TPA: trypsin-like peptidase domain-containing protein [Baekduia sp.]
MSIAPSPHGSRRTVSPALALSAVALLGVIALTIVLLATGSFGDGGSTPAAPAAASTASTASVSRFDPAALYASSNPGVVDISAQGSTSVPGPFGLAEKAATTQSGTGLVLDHAGHLLTADHVVAGTHDITVTFQGGATRSAKIMGGDAGTDVAVLSVDPKGLDLHPLPLGSLSDHRVGDPVAVIGDPFAVERSLSTGVISGLDRTISAPNGFNIPHAVQTDAAINPGNSGGPVLDNGGRVIGIADQIDTGDSGGDSSTGVGFAVPVDIIKSELSQLERGITPAHADIGVGATDVSGADGPRGALVQSLVRGGAAAAAGVRLGDLVVAVGGHKVAGVNDLIAAVAKLTPGQKTTITVVRDGKTLSLSITPAKQPTRAVSG